MSIDSTQIELPDALLDALRQSRHAVVFTGAGVSAESGIPTFRDEQSGLWANFVAEDLATPSGFRSNPPLVWGWYEWRRKHVASCQPNAAHHSIVALAKHLPSLIVITQNIDDLHERAGSHDVIHVHGSLFAPRCFDCDQPWPLPPDDHESAPKEGNIPPPICPHCNGIVRPGVVWFHELLPSGIWGQAKEAIRHCDLLISIGTSAVVYPAAVLPFEAAERGATVIHVNPEVTDLDAVATFNLHGKAAEIMPRLLAAWPG